MVEIKVSLCIKLKSMKTVLIDFLIYQSNQRDNVKGGREL